MSEQVSNVYAKQEEDLPVEEFTTPGPEFAAPDDSLDQVLALMQAHQIHHVPCVHENKIVGIVSDRDIYKALSESRSGQDAVEKYMTREVFTVQVSDPIYQVALGMSKQRINSAIVLDEQKNIYGIFTSTDALNALVEILRGEL